MKNQFIKSFTLLSLLLFVTSGCSEYQEIRKQTFSELDAAVEKVENTEVSYLVVSNNIPKGKRIEKNDLSVKVIKIKDEPKKVKLIEPKDENFVIGKRLKTDLLQGQFVTKEALEWE